MDVLKVNEEALRQRIVAEVERILDERANPTYRTVSDQEAESEITEFLLKEKDKGNTRISVPDVVRSLKLVPEQVEAVLEKFEKQGRLKEAWD